MRRPECARRSPSPEQRDLSLDQRQCLPRPPEPVQRVFGGQVLARPMMYLALSYDHRLIDGREAVQFLVRVKDCIETPERMLLET